MGANYYIRKPSCVTLSKHYDFMWDKHNLFVHVGRSTNGWLIWNIFPCELEAMKQAGCVPYYEDGTVVTWEDLETWIARADRHDFDYAGKGQKFC